MSERRERVHIEHALPKTRRCQLLAVARSSAYYQPTPVSAADLSPCVKIVAASFAQ